MTDPETLAKSRHKRLSIIRLWGVVLAFIGAACMADKVAVPAPHLLGVIMFMGGIFYTMFFPRMLIRRWKKQDQG